jgi:GH24 family phage-related lysozyme (muramidase)
LNHFGLLDLQKTFAQPETQSKVIQQAEQIQQQEEQIKQHQQGISEESLINRLEKGRAAPLVTVPEEEKIPTAATPVSNELTKMIARHEGNEPTVYPDSEGIPTIGIGFNLQREDAAEKLSNLGLDITNVLNGQELTDEQIKSLFQDDVRTATADAKSFLPNFDQQPEVVKNILVDMSFNLGATRLGGFDNFREALLRGDYQAAAREMVDSKWYGQVGDRSKELVSMMKGIR